MGQRSGLLVVATAAALLAGCASSRSAPPAGNQIPRQQAVVLRVNPPATQVGGAVVGRTAQALVALLGQPALDVHEGSARKLQFLNGDCVLDAYLYAPRSGAEPVVTHVDARLPDGRDTDGETCTASLRRR